MTTALRRFVSALSREGIDQLYQLADLPPIGGDELSRRERTNRSVQAVLDASSKVRIKIEALANSVTMLTGKSDLAERALREVCQSEHDLLDILESDRSREERIFEVWLKNPRTLDRARNVAQAYHWRCSQYHCGFDVSNASSLSSDIRIAVETIGQLIQQMQGGRKVGVDHFTYVPEDGSVIPIHHVAIYLEAPAAFSMEFTDGENYPLTMVRRQAKEVAIDYDPKKGRLDIAGKGIGGFRTFDRLARSFCETALSDAEFVTVTRPEWNLSPFLEGIPPSLAPPDGFSSFLITEIATTSKGKAGTQLVLRAEKGEDVYQHANDLGIRLVELPPQYVRSIAVTLYPLPSVDETEPREVQVHLTWPNGRSFDGASLSDQANIEPWLESPQFHSPH